MVEFIPGHPGRTILKRLLLAGALSVALTGCSFFTPPSTSAPCPCSKQTILPKAHVEPAKDERSPPSDQARPGVESKLDDCIDACCKRLPTKYGDGCDFFKCVNKCMGKATHDGEGKK